MKSRLVGAAIVALFWMHPPTSLASTSDLPVDGITGAVDFVSHEGRFIWAVTGEKGIYRVSGG